MFFLFGERVRRRMTAAGNRECAVCRDEREFVHALETSYFTVFGFPVAPLESVADYVLCQGCETAFPDMASAEPSHVTAVRLVSAYIMTGYGMRHQIRIIQDIAARVSGFPFPSSDIERTIIDLEGDDIMKRLSGLAVYMNESAKLKIIEAAFLATHVCCEIQYEDRLRVNLMGNALGVSLQFVEYAVSEVRRQRYYGVPRLLPTQPMAE
ncbi:MAG: hypothetical protein O2780_10085 [Proteobacteria bacterium]|nr:hypothetical protein [Pseudomonadota bacterium]MDA1299602.1 hypothetical protein [Pseudomonadota bacterium]